MYPRPFYGGGRHFHEGLGWGGWLLWVLFMVALWAVVIMAVVWLVRSFTHRGSVTAQRGMRLPGGPQAWRSGGTGTVPAEQILAERFAHGQIDENEYRARLEVLRGNRPGGASRATGRLTGTTPDAPDASGTTAGSAAAVRLRRREPRRRDPRIDVRRRSQSDKSSAGCRGSSIRAVRDAARDGSASASYLA